MRERVVDEHTAEAVTNEVRRTAIEVLAREACQALDVRGERRTPSVAERMDAITGALG